MYESHWTYFSIIKYQNFYIIQNTHLYYIDKNIFVILYIFYLYKKSQYFE